jgi:hypothetical protein
MFRSMSKQTDSMMHFTNKIGDASLPLERPEMLDEDLLKQLHHVLLEVSQSSRFPSLSRRVS